MSERQETVADIVAEIRGANFQPPYYQKRVNEYADRLEEAWKRERENLTLGKRSWE